MKKEQVIKIAENLRDTFRERLKNSRNFNFRGVLYSKTAI